MINHAENFPPLENYPPVVEAVMRQNLPFVDAPLDWVAFTGTGMMFDGIIHLYPSRAVFFMSLMVWALVWFLVAVRLDRRGWTLSALSAFGTGWGGACLLLILGYTYFLQVSVLVTVVFPLMAPFAAVIALCGASRLIDGGAPAWMGWGPRTVLRLAHRIGVLPKILTPCAFKCSASNGRRHENRVCNNPSQAELPI